MNIVGACMNPPPCLHVCVWLTDPISSARVHAMGFNKVLANLLEVSARLSLYISSSPP